MIVKTVAELRKFLAALPDRTQLRGMSQCDRGYSWRGDLDVRVWKSTGHPDLLLFGGVDCEERH